MIRKSFGEYGAAHPLALEIDLRHQIDGPLLVDVESGLAARHLDLARPQHDLHGGGEEDRIGRAHVLMPQRRSTSLELLRPRIRVSVIGRRATRLTITTSIPPSGARCSLISSMNVRMMKMPRPLAFRTFSGASGSGDVRGIEPRALVTHADGDASRSGVAQRRELDVHVLALVVAVAMLDGVDHRLTNRDADPVQGVVIESSQPSEVIACHLHEVEHFVGAVKV